MRKKISDEPLLSRRQLAALLGGSIETVKRREREGALRGADVSPLIRLYIAYPAASILRLADLHAEGRVL